MNPVDVATMGGVGDTPAQADANGVPGAPGSDALGSDGTIASVVLDAAGEGGVDAPADAPVAVLTDAPTDNATLDVGSDSSPDVPFMAPDVTPDVAPDLAPPDAPPPSPAVVFNEIMYHPVDDFPAPDRHNDPTETREYIEIYNRAYFPIDLGNWTLAGEVTFTFPAATIIAPGAYLVIARDKTAFASTYGAGITNIVGNYLGKLGNGGGTVELRNAANAVVDTLTYDDRFPWPVGADALGAGGAWLGMSDAQYATHKFKGRSLERYAFDVATNEISNWGPSPLDGMTPGVANSLGGVPPRIVTGLSAAPNRVGGDTLIRAADTVAVVTTFSTLGALSNPKVEWFVDDLAVTNESRTKTVLVASGANYDATLPAQANNSIVRYRIVGDRGAGEEVISPRPSDPNPWHAYFVSPVVTTNTVLYQLFIAKAAWTTMGTNIFGASGNITTPNSRVNDDGCTIRDSWDAREFGVFVYQGVVYDVRLRYQGSRWNRRNGLDIPNNLRPANYPDTPAPLKALSWNVSFPRFQDFQGRGSLVLNKLNQSCPGIHAGLGQRLYTMAGVPVSNRKYVRLHVNGSYYHYMMDIDHIDADTIKPFVTAGQPNGEIFKSEGLDGDEGPFGWGDEKRLLPRSCTGATWTELQRYKYTFNRQTNDWKDHSDLQSFIQGMSTARAASNVGNSYQPLRDFFTANVDVQAVLNYLAIRNWSGVWDDYFQNHFLWRKGDGKWLIIPWDLDEELGLAGDSRASMSFYVGEQGDPTNRGGMTNELKDNFIKAYRTELKARIIQLSMTVLSPASVKTQMDLAAAEYNETEAQTAPAGVACSAAWKTSVMKDFVDARHTEVQCALVGTPCGGLKGQYYTWSGGNPPANPFMAGDLKLTRNDRWIDFNWSDGRPDPALPSDDNFAVVWTGTVTPQFSELYTFYTVGDDGMRIFIDGNKVTDDWSNHGERETAGTPTMLTGGNAHTIRVEHYEASGGAAARVRWSSASQPKQIIPPTRLTPAP